MTANRDEERGPLIAEGRTAQVYAWGQDRVVKVLRPGFPDRLGEAEADAAQLADAAGIGAPPFHGLVRVDGRVGLVYERRDGVSMNERLAAGPWAFGSHAQMLGGLHAAMHATAAESLPRFRDAIDAAIRGAEPSAGVPTCDAALARLDALPDGTALCHGDFHPGNVVLGAGPPTIIDWLTATSGPPAADVARTLLLLRDSALPAGLPPIRRLQIGLLRRWFVGRYLRAYRAARPLDLTEVARWRLPLLVARLDEGIEAERPRLLGLIRHELRRR